VFTGSSWHLPIPLTVELSGEQTQFRAHYSTRPFSGAPYYSYRLGHAWESGRALEVEMLHNKLYLENPQPPIERLEISHGYNQPMANVMWPDGRWQFRIGFGIVVAHPEGTIAGRSVNAGETLLGGGYHIAGLTVQAALGRRWGLWGRSVKMTAVPEVKITASWASIPLEHGRVMVPDISLNALGGVGVWRCG
jgi:hypothetical protein